MTFCLNILSILYFSLILLLFLFLNQWKQASMGCDRNSFSLSLTESATVNHIIYLFISSPHIIYFRDHHRAKIVKRRSRSRLHHLQERFHHWTQTGFQPGYHSIRSRLLLACELQVKDKSIRLISISNHLFTSTIYNIIISGQNHFKVAHQRGNSAPPACGSWPGDPALWHSGPQHPASSSPLRSRTYSRSPRTASIQRRSGNLKRDNATLITQPITSARTSVKTGPGGLTDQELRWVWGSVRPSSHKCNRGSWSSWSSPTCRHNSLEESGTHAMPASTGNTWRCQVESADPTCEDLSAVPQVGSVFGPAGTVVRKFNLGFIHPVETPVLILIWWQIMTKEHFHKPHLS